MFPTTDTNIQGFRNTAVRPEFSNTVSGKFGSSLNRLGARVPTLKHQV